MSRQQDLQRARRDRAEGRTGPLRARLDRERQAELLIAQVLDVLAQREAVVTELDLRTGRLLTRLKALGWPPAREVAEVCGLTVREASRLRDLVRSSAVAPTLDGSTTVSDAKSRQRSEEE